MLYGMGKSGTTEPIAGSVAGLVGSLASADASTAHTGQVVQSFHVIRQLQGWLDAEAAKWAARADELAAQGSGAGLADTVARTTKTSAAEARKVERRARLLRDVPAFADALSAGHISAAHVDALSNATWRLGEPRRSNVLAHADALLTLATQVAPEAFGRRCKALVARLADDGGTADHVELTETSIVIRRIDPVTGMHRIVAEYDPETGARLFTAIDTEANSLAAGIERVTGERPADRGHLAALALAGLVLSAHRSKRPGKAEVVVLIDEQSLRDRLHARGVCELADGTQIPVETARRLACDAGILPVVLNGSSVPLDLGRRQRLASDDQRRALRAIYTCCAFPDCDVPFDRCEVHHALEWSEQQGPTDLRFLLPVCSRHHHALHERGWQLELDDDRTLTILRPDGTLHAWATPTDFPCDTPPDSDRSPARTSDSLTTENPGRRHACVVRGSRPCPRSYCAASGSGCVPSSRATASGCSRSAAPRPSEPVGTASISTPSSTRD
jgi:hypothetical protein